MNRRIVVVLLATLSAGCDPAAHKRLAINDSAPRTPIQTVLAKVDAKAAEEGFHRVEAFSARSIQKQQELGYTILAWYDTEKTPSDDRGSMTYLMLVRDSSKGLVLESLAFPSFPPGPKNLRNLREYVTAQLCAEGYVVEKSC